MADSLAVFKALDTAKTQLYHFKAIVIAGMGFFTDAYDLFCITAVTNILGRLYYFDPSSPKPGKLPKDIKNVITGVALFGTLTGQLFFGWLGDKLGRKKVYGITLITMAGCALASGLSFGSTSSSVVATLCFFRFWLGFGIGGDYPLSAVIMSEYANQKTRGAFIAAVFAMQGVGILFAGAISIMVSKVFIELEAYPAPSYQVNKVLSTQPEADLVWRIVLMLGAIPAGLTFYWRMKMPETARYTALVEGDHKKAASDMAKVLEQEFSAGDSKYNPNPNPNPNLNRSSTYSMWSAEFLSRHGIHLLGTASTWFLLDIAFYTLNLAQTDIYPSAGLLHKASRLNALQEMFQLSKAMSLVAVLAIIPGYWFTVLLIDRIGRFMIQLNGFLMMTILMVILGFQYGNLRGEKDNCKPDSETDYCGGHPALFILLYGLTFFFANFGPNSTTFIVPAELYPARFRSTCHGISAAAGKAGAILGAFVVQKYTQDGESGGIKKAILGLAAVNFLGFLCTFMVPETKGKSLEELSGEDKELARVAHVDSFCRHSSDDAEREMA